MGSLPRGASTKLKSRLQSYICFLGGCPALVPILLCGSGSPCQPRSPTVHPQVHGTCQQHPPQHQDSASQCIVGFVGSWPIEGKGA